jgi:hypothetical protein
MCASSANTTRPPHPSLGSPVRSAGRPRTAMPCGTAPCHCTRRPWPSATTSPRPAPLRARPPGSLPSQTDFDVKNERALLCYSNFSVGGPAVATEAYAVCARQTERRDVHVGESLGAAAEGSCEQERRRRWRNEGWRRDKALRELLRAPSIRIIPTPNSAQCSGLTWRTHRLCLGCIRRQRTRTSALHLWTFASPRLLSTASRRSRGWRMEPRGVCALYSALLQSRRSLGACSRAEYSYGVLVACSCSYRLCALLLRAAPCSCRPFFRVCLLAIDNS